MRYIYYWQKKSDYVEHGGDRTVRDQIQMEHSKKRVARNLSKKLAFLDYFACVWPCVAFS